MDNRVILFDELDGFPSCDDVEKLVDHIPSTHMKTFFARLFRNRVNSAYLFFIFSDGSSSCFGVKHFDRRPLII